ncbi:MAG: GNAT family N-acetyltransferase [Parachlamydiales bacterium]|nr:GNAT family N-acetyltransferase [Parachlamydiales bacterium]
MNAQIRKMSLPIERQAAKEYRQKYFFDRAAIQDPYLWTFDHKEHLHFVIYQKNQIVGYAHVQLWPDKRAAMRIIVIDEKFRGAGLGRYLLSTIERILKEEGIRILQTESRPDTYFFYKNLGYVDMPFNDPEGDHTDPQDKPMGKVLSEIK